MGEIAQLIEFFPLTVIYDRAKREPTRSGGFQPGIRESPENAAAD
jgi:hypothetical protein